jgi:hypothetical protein
VARDRQGSSNALTLPRVYARCLPEDALPQVASRSLGSACQAQARLTASGAESWRTAGRYEPSTTMAASAVARSTVVLNTERRLGWPKVSLVPAAYCVPATCQEGRPGTQPAVSQSHWSVLGPHGIGKRRSSAGASGHDRCARIPAHRAFTPTTSGSRLVRRRVRTPHRRSCRRPPALANEARVALDGPHPIARAGPVATRSQPRSSLPAVPSPCHSEHDASGSPWSATDTLDRLTSVPCITGARQHEW